MTETPAKAADIRSARLDGLPPGTRSRDRTCAFCGASLEGRRSDAEYCDAACRKRDWRDRAHVGQVAGVRRLKSGGWSVTVHLPADVGLAPGDECRVGAYRPAGEAE